MFDTFQIIGHRGWSAKYPENTLLSFEKSIEAGATMIEFDIQLTKDNKLIVFHDDTTKRLCGRHLEISRSSSDALSELKVKDEPVSFLPNVFDKFDSDINYYVELKTFKNSTIEYKRKLTFYTINEIMRRNLRSKCLIVSFDVDCLKVAKQLGYNNLGVNCVSKKQPILTKVTCKDHKAIKGVIEDRKREGKRHGDRTSPELIYAWTVNNKRRMKTLINYGVKGIVTDHPDRLSEVYKDTLASSAT